MIVLSSGLSKTSRDCNRLAGEMAFCGERLTIEASGFRCTQRWR